MLPKPKFLVTGASGFIGSHLVPALVRAFGPESVTAMVHSQSPLQERKALKQFQTLGVSILECDLLRLPETNPDRPSFDVLYHLAAYAITEDPQGAFEVNSDGTRNLLNWLGPSLSQKRLIYTGTLASFDKRDPDSPISETTPCRPLTRYGWTKLEGEKWVQTQAGRWGYSYTILRLCTIIGPGFRPGGMFGVFPEMLRRNAVAVRLNWPDKVSFLSVDDLVEILLAIPNLTQTKNEIYLAGNGEEITFDTLLDQMAAELRVQRSRVVLPGWLWRSIGAVAWSAASFKVLPYRSQNFFWRVSHLIRNGLYADATRLNNLVGREFQSTREALQKAYRDQV